MNSYDVKFIYDYAVISTCVFALHEDAAQIMAVDQICHDLDLSTELLYGAGDISVTLLDEDVL